MIIQLLPFIIFVTSMKFIIDIRNNRDLVTMKIFGFSNFKIFLILAFTSFFIGWLILFLFNPVTSAMSKYYEKTKASYSKDIDHLVTFNKNGLWIKESLVSGQQIITASKKTEKNLKDVTIYVFDEKYNLRKKIFSKTADIETNLWVLDDVLIVKFDEGMSTKIKKKSIELESIYTFEKITNLYKNIDTLSFY